VDPVYQNLGIIQNNFRFRVMKDCYFGLLRHYIRVDDVVVRIFDTRIYHEFGKNYVLREFSVKYFYYNSNEKIVIKNCRIWDLNFQLSG
jgi:type 2A phosphatase activator TIP41